MRARAHTRASRRAGANPVQNVATGGIAQRINGAIATERIRTTGRPVVLPREPMHNDILSTEGLSSLKQSVRLAAAQKSAARPTQQTAAPRRQTVLFAVQKKTRYGQTVRLVGDSSELGAWSMDNAIDLLWGEGHEWHAHVQLPPGMHTFKFVLVDSEGCVDWESTENRRIEICPMTASSQYCTSWNTTKAHTSSAPLLHRALGHPQVALSGAASARLPSLNGKPPAPTPRSRSASASAPAPPAPRSASGPPAGPSSRWEPPAPSRTPQPSFASPSPAAPAPAAGAAARGSGGASTSGRPAAPAAQALDIFAVCGIKAKLWKVDLGGMADAFGIFDRPAAGPSSSSSSRKDLRQQPRSQPAAAAGASGSGSRSSSALGATTSGSSAAASSRKLPSTPPSRATPTPSAPHPRSQQPRAVVTQAATAVVAAPPAPLPTRPPTAAPAEQVSTTQKVADARSKLQQLLGGSSTAAAAAAAAVASRRAVAAEEAAMMSALVVARPHQRAVSRKLRPEERAALMRKAQYNSDDGRPPAGAKPVVLEATVQQRMAMLFTGLITGAMPDSPLW